VVLNSVFIVGVEVNLNSDSDSGSQYTSALFRVKVTNYLAMALKSIRNFSVNKINDSVTLSNSKANCTLICTVKYECVLNVAYYI
jgi:hypothetical protein